MSSLMSLEGIKTHFLNSLDSYQNIIDTIKGLEKIKPSKDEKFYIHTKVAEKITGQIFVGICASWETFLEDTFIRYMNHAKGPTYSPVTTKSKFRNISECYDILNQEFNSMYSRYPSIWTDTNKLIKTAKIYFQNGEPYSWIDSKYKNFFDASKHIRNYSAHDSNKALTNFKKLCAPLIGPQTNTYSPGNILLRKTAYGPWFNAFNFFTAANFKSTALNNFDAFIEGYKELADLIVK